MTPLCRHNDVISSRARRHIAALDGRIGVEVGVRRRAAKARQSLCPAIARVTGELVIDPVQAEQERYERARLALQRVR